MKIQFQIDYINKDGDSVETFSCVKIDEDGRKLLHDSLDEYLDKHDFTNHEACNKFYVGGVCESHT